MGRTGKIALGPSWLPRLGWSLDNKGYVLYTSRKKNSLRRGSKMHRLVIEKLLGRKLLDNEQVHHQDFDKLNNRPENLILMPGCFNGKNDSRDPYTGQYLTRDEALRRYGTGEPDWIYSGEDGEEE